VGGSDALRRRGMMKLALHDQLARRRFEMHNWLQPEWPAEDQSGPALWRGLPPGLDWTVRVKHVEAALGKTAGDIR
jgi:hypothetical protein